MKRTLKSVMAIIIAVVICMSSMLTSVSFAKPQKNNGASVFATQGSAVIEGVKVWDDDNDANGLRPDSITVELYKEGEKVAETKATAANGWKFTFNVDSYLDENGEPIEYTVKEQPVENYEQTALTNPVVTKAFTVGNFGKYTPNSSLTISVDTAMIVIKKGNNWTVWTEKALSADEEAAAIPQIKEAGNINGNAKFEFYTGDIGNGITIDTVNDTITFGKTNQWSWLLAGEMSFATVSDASITNTLNLPEPPATINVEGRKTWNDDNDRDGKRPESIIINLLADGEAVAEAEVTADDGWAWKFENVLKYNEDGTEIVYTITENAVVNYTTEVDGFTVTNTVIPVEKTSIVIEGVKYLDGAVSGGFTFQLTDAEGNVIGNAESTTDGSFAFETIVFDKAGNYTYTVTEIAGDDEEIIYDNAVYTVYVTVTEADNALSAEVSVAKNGESYNDSIVFNNETKEPEEIVEIEEEETPRDDDTTEIIDEDVPLTGDDNNASYLPIMIVSIVMFGVTAFFSLKKAK